MPLSTYLDNKVITDNISTGTKYVQVHSADPTKAGTVSPITTGGFARTACTFVAPTAGATSNTSDITWTGLTFAGTVTHVSVWDASTTGNCLAYGALTTPKTLESGDKFEIAGGELDITVD